MKYNGRHIPPFEFTPVDADMLVKGKDFKEASKNLQVRTQPRNCMDIG